MKQLKLKNEDLNKALFENVAFIFEDDMGILCIYNTDGQSFMLDLAYEHFETEALKEAIPSYFKSNPKKFKKEWTSIHLGLRNFLYIRNELYDKVPDDSTIRSINSEEELVKELLKSIKKNNSIIGKYRINNADRMNFIVEDIIDRIEQLYKMVWKLEGEEIQRLDVKKLMYINIYVKNLIEDWKLKKKIKNSKKKHSI